MQGVRRFTICNAYKKNEIMRAQGILKVICKTNDTLKYFLLENILHVIKQNKTIKTNIGKPWEYWII